jgi:hypothetical protein
MQVPERIRPPFQAHQVLLTVLYEHPVYSTTLLGDNASWRWHITLIFTILPNKMAPFFTSIGTYGFSYDIGLGL